MRITRLTPDQYLRQPWKNGGGITTEIARHDADGRMIWRLSMAAVEASGPFSDFSGYQRTIMLLKGNGMLLSFDRAPMQRIDCVNVPFDFAGEWQTQCRLIDGPVEDFNLMVDRRRARGSLEILEVSAATQSCPLPGDTGILYALRGRLNVAADGNVFLLDAGEALRVEDCKLGAAAQSIALGAIDLPCRVAVVRIGAVSVE